MFVSNKAAQKPPSTWLPVLVVFDCFRLLDTSLGRHVRLSKPWRRESLLHTGIEIWTLQRKNAFLLDVPVSFEVRLRR